MSIQEKWYKEGEAYAKAVNEMVDFAEKYGWDKWDELKKPEPEDNRANLAKEVFNLLKKANLENKIEEFRADFPPAHEPFTGMFEEKSQSIEQICIITDNKIAFIVGAPYEENRQAYLLDGTQVTPLNPKIKGFGRAKKGNIFAIAYSDKIITTEGWEGNAITELKREITKNFPITEIIPFNDGKRVLLISAKGIYLISENEEKLLKYGFEREEEDDDECWIDMEHATLSHDNKYIAVGDQDSDHCILDENGNKIKEFYPESSYPHFCLFSKDDKQLIFNSCHFYNGVTISVDMNNFQNIKEDAENPLIDEAMRVYAGVSVEDYYILGDAYGYIKAFDKTGKMLWRHFLGSTICSIAISDDSKTLWVGAYSGFLHKLSLGKGHRDTHTIGTGNHYEDFRLIIWKNEPQIWRW